MTQRVHWLVWMLAFTLVAELASAWWLAPFLPLDTRYHRNPHYQRAWDQYVTATIAQRGSGQNVLIVSSSQAVGLEVAEEAIYPALLERRLNEPPAASEVRVTNWSIPAAHGPDVVALLSRAPALAPDLVVAVLGPGSFLSRDHSNDGRPTPLALFPSDVTDSAWLYRDQLPDGFRDHYFTVETPLVAWLFELSPSFRVRDRPVASLIQSVPWLARFAPPVQRATWQYANNANNPDDAGNEDKARNARPRRQAQPVPNGELMTWFLEAGSQLRAPKVFVIPPYGTPVENRAPLVALFRRHFEARGWLVWDMSQALDPSLFVNRAAHLNMVGHARFAELLAQRIGPIVRRKR